MSEEKTAPELKVVSEESATYEGVWVTEEGRIRSNYKGSRGQEINQTKEGCRLIEGTFDSKATETMYFDKDDRVQKRPAVLETLEYVIKADGVDEISLSVPVNTEIRKGTSEMLFESIEDGLFEFDTVVPGVYEFQIRPPFPYQFQMIKVIANAP